MSLGHLRELLLLGAGLTLLWILGKALLRRLFPVALPQRPYVAKPFLTASELEFLDRLEWALPEFRIHCQVSMGALLKPGVPARGLPDQRRLHAAILNQFSQKFVDYVVQRRSDGGIVAIVALDDRVNTPEKARHQDSMLQQAGYRTIRWASRNKPSPDEIRARVLDGR